MSEHRHIIDLSKFGNFWGERGLKTWLEENPSIFFKAVDAANETVKLAAVVRATYYENLDNEPDSFVTEAYLVPQDEAIEPTRNASEDADLEEVRNDPCQMFVCVKFHLSDGQRVLSKNHIVYRFSPMFFLPVAEIVDTPKSYLDSLGDILPEIMAYLWVKGTIPREARGFLRIIIGENQTVTCQFKPYASIGQFLYKFEYDFYDELREQVNNYDPQDEIVVGMNSEISSQYLIGPIEFSRFESFHQNILNFESLDVLKSRVEAMLKNPLPE